MFTGIVEEVGTVEGLEVSTSSARLRVSCKASLVDARLGASIAVNGACLTIVELSENGFAADLSPETLQRTNLGELETGDEVNLERTLRATGRLDGHFVQGHVDGKGVLTSLTDIQGDNWWMQVALPQDLSRYVVSKGSLAVDGISLTVAEVKDNLASFAVIPHTYAHTALHNRKLGDHVNVEVDILAKHLEKLIPGNLAGSRS